MKRITIFFLLLYLLYSCADLLSPEDKAPVDMELSEYKTVTMSLPPLSFDGEESKTRINLDLGTLKYVWAEQDSVGIFPDQGSQIYFSMADGVGQSVATFDGGGWALKRGSDYYSYFPFTADYYIDKKAIPISYIGQKQNGNGDGSSAELGPYCFMVAKGVADEATGDLMFTYERLQCPFMFVIPVEAGMYKGLDICAGENVLAVSGTMNALSLDKIINDAVYDDHLSVELESINFATAGTIVVTAVLPPFDIFGKQLTVNLIKSDGTTVTSSVFGKTYALGKAYRIAPNFSVSPSSMEISGNETTFQIVITAAESCSYTISTDDDWLTITDAASSGSAVVTIKAAKGEAKKRVGNIIVSENVTYNGKTITLQNKVEVVQDYIGLSVGIEGWEDSDNDYGGVVD